MKKIKCTFSGLLKATMAVALGVLLSTGALSAQGTATVTINPGQAIGPNPGTWNFPMDIAGIPAFAPIEAVGVEITLSHTWSSDLVITMTDPAGNANQLANNLGGSCDWVQANPITFVDTSANGLLACTASPLVCSSACDFNVQQGYMYPLNGADYNGSWNLQFVDEFFGDGGTLAQVTLTVYYGALGDTTCNLVCPPSETINLGPGECFAPYSYTIALEGGLPGCELFPDPIPGFQGAFDFSAGNFCQNCPSNSLGFPTTCWEIATVDQFVFSSTDFFNCNCCPFFGTMQQWRAPEDITIEFDWVYETDDVTPANDPFGYTVGTDWNGVVATIANLTNLTQNLVDIAGPNTQSGHAVIPVAAGEDFAFIIWSGTGLGGDGTATITNFETGLTPPSATATQIAGPPSGSLLPSGETYFEWLVTLLDGSTLTCNWTVDVVEFTNGTSVLACNDHVQVSVDQNCEALVTTDMILEGGPYNCYDGYLVAIEGYGAGLGGMTIDEDAIGQTLQVTVTDTLTGNSCWGTISVEDKLPPVIICDTITLPCGLDTDPQFTPPLTAFVSESDDTGYPIDQPSGTNCVFDVVIPVNAPLGYAVTDVNVVIDITHTWTSDISAEIISPTGASSVLFDGPCGASDNIDATFDDDGAAPMCGANPALSGVIRPAQALANLNGSLASGNWILRIDDGFCGADGGSLNLVQLDIQLEELQATAPMVVENCSEYELEYDDEEVGDDCEGFAIERTWTATDASGNSSTCVQLINITPLDLSALTCPETYEGECGESLDPSNTGYPAIAGVEITDGSICNIFLDYWDKELSACGNGTKIVRTWTILDWCTQQTTECVQIIKLEATGVDLVCPDDQTVGADPWHCVADVNLTPPTVVDLCGGAEYTLTPSTDNGVIVDFGGFYRVDDLPLGTTTITWTAEDDCGNESTCSYTITVIDDVPPVPLCDEHTIVSLSTDADLNQGLTKIPAEVFDDGSYDNCGEVTFTARRMTSCIDFDWTTGGACIDEIKNGLVTSPDRGTAFRPCVPFACCDVAAGPIMVELRVQDEAGNVNSCMVEVEVQDKLSPFITCPPSVYVSCDFWFDAKETNGFVPQEEDVLTPVFGRVLDAFDYEPEDRQDIIIDDPGNDELPQPYNWGLEGWADDNCDVEITVRVRIYDDCSGDDLPGVPPHPYAVRLIERTFLARDAQGNSQTCVQRIWVVDFDPFYISDETCVNADPQDGVIWPCDEEYDFCPQDGIPVNYPTIFDDNCSLIGVTYDDTRFDFVDGACYKILREWTIIDWCQYNSQTGEGLWSYIQVIKVIDNEPAAILGCYDQVDPITRSVLDPGVTLPANNQVFLGEGNPLATSCSVHYTDTFGINEFCSSSVIYDVKIYPFNGSDFLQIHKKTTVPIDSNGSGQIWIDTKTSDILGVRLNGLPYNDRFCINGEKDVHRVLITVEDGCGNVSTCEYLLRLEDRKAPSPVCVGLSSVVMPSSGSVTIWAKDFNASSFDDCTAAEDLLFSFSGDSYQPSMVFDCDALEANGSNSFFVEIWAADEGNDMDCSNGLNPISWAERNKDFCSTFIVIDDNEGVCGNGGSGGIIQTEEQEPVEKVVVNLTNGQGETVLSYTTDKDGVYNFAGLQTLLGLSANAERNDDHDNGVTTLDLVKIQKHLLGIEDLGSPYKLIAADANNSQSVSAIDLVELRKLILGLYTELPNNESWRFADGSQTFADPSNPWPFAEATAMEAGMGNDFMGIKVGDVNGTVAANANSIETRNVTGTLNFATVEQSVVAGEEVVVEVTSSNFNNIIGYQFTLNTDGLALTDITAGAIDMAAENIAVHKSAITASWNRVTPVALTSNDVLFTMTFTATTSGNLSEMLSMSSRLTAAEAYNGEEEIFDVAITFGTDLTPAGKDFALYQNAPNPFNGETVVAFTLPEAMSATLTVFDVTGKVVYNTEGDYAAGYNQVTLSAKNLSATGVLYYRLDADDFTATKKMVLID